MGDTRALLLAVTTTVAVTGVPTWAEQAPLRSDQVVRSFDGTPLWTQLFLPLAATGAAPVPLVLRTHGWAGTADREPHGTVAQLLDAGYAVLTWDSRGFGHSGGEVQLNKPDVEGRDVSALIDWAVDNAPIATDTDGDPVVGLTGGSYAGAIQTAAAAIDDRIDAIAPEISWSDLRYSLYQGGVVNSSWGSMLYAAGVQAARKDGLDPPAGPQTGGLAPELHRAYAEFVATNQLSDEALTFLADSSLARYGQDRVIDVPTLVMNGSVDTLFDLTDGNGIFQHVRAQGAPAKYVIFCGGHVRCPYPDADDRAHLDRAILAWFARYLDGRDVDTGPAVEYRTNEAVWRGADDFPPSSAVFVTADGDDTVIQPGAPAVDGPPSGPTTGPHTMAAPNPPGDPAALTVEVAAADRRPLELVGVPRATVTVTGEGPVAHLFVKLVHREAGHVIHHQEASLRVEHLSSDPQQFELDLPGVAYTVPEGDHLDVQVATSSTVHALARHPARAAVRVEVTVPVVGGTAKTGGDGEVHTTGPVGDRRAPHPPSDPRWWRLAAPAAGIAIAALAVGVVAVLRRG